MVCEPSFDRFLFDQFEETRMLLKRLMVILGVVAFVLATVGTSLIVSGANAGPDDRKPATENKDSGGPAFKRLGF
jgi:hypothetical protein